MNAPTKCLLGDVQDVDTYFMLSNWARKNCNNFQCNEHVPLNYVRSFRDDAMASTFISILIVFKDDFYPSIVPKGSRGYFGSLFLTLP